MQGWRQQLACTDAHAHLSGPGGFDCAAARRGMAATTAAATAAAMSDLTDMLTESLRGGRHPHGRHHRDPNFNGGRTVLAL